MWKLHRKNPKTLLFLALLVCGLSISSSLFAARTFKAEPGFDHLHTYFLNPQYLDPEDFIPSTNELVIFIPGAGIGHNHLVNARKQWRQAGYRTLVYIQKLEDPLFDQDAYQLALLLDEALLEAKKKFSPAKITLFGISSGAFGIWTSLNRRDSVVRNEVSRAILRGIFFDAFQMIPESETQRMANTVKLLLENGIERSLIGRHMQNIQFEAVLKTRKSSGRIEPRRFYRNYFQIGSFFSMLRLNTALGFHKIPSNVLVEVQYSASDPYMGKLGEGLQVIERWKSLMFPHIQFVEIKDKNLHALLRGGADLGEFVKPLPLSAPSIADCLAKLQQLKSQADPDTDHLPSTPDIPLELLNNERLHQFEF